MHAVHQTDPTPYDGQIRTLISTVKSDFVPYEGYYPPSNPAQVNVDFFDNYMSDSEHTILLFDEQTLIGLFCLEPDCHREDVPVAEPFSYFSLVMVHPDYRGAGLGNMIQEIVWNLRECGHLHDTIASSTWSGNTTQRHLFEKYGWSVHETVQNHRANGDNTVYYRLSPSVEMPSRVAEHNVRKLLSCHRFELNG